MRQETDLSASLQHYYSATTKVPFTSGMNWSQLTLGSVFKHNPVDGSPKSLPTNALVSRNTASEVSTATGAPTKFIFVYAQAIFDFRGHQA